MEPPVALIRIREDGDLELFAFGEGEMRFLVVDELAPGDRVFEITTRIERWRLALLVPAGEPIGNQDDSRHAASVHRLNSAIEGRPHLKLVTTEAVE